MARVYANPCPGAGGHGCPHGHHLRRDSVGGLCFHCRLGKAAAGESPAPEVVVAEVPAELASHALQLIRPLCPEALRRVVAPELLDQLMLGCYMQGLVHSDVLAKRSPAA